MCYSQPLLTTHKALHSLLYFRLSLVAKTKITDERLYSNGCGMWCLVSNRTQAPSFSGWKSWRATRRSTPTSRPLSTFTLGNLCPATLSEITLHHFCVTSSCIFFAWRQRVNPPHLDVPQGAVILIAVNALQQAAVFRGKKTKKNKCALPAPTYKMLIVE